MTNYEARLLSGELTIVIDSVKDREFLKKRYNIIGEGIYLRLDEETENLILTTKGLFTTPILLPSETFIATLDD